MRRAAARKSAFPPLALSAGQQQQFERLARALVRETLADYEHFWGRDRREVDAARWKPVRRRANIVVYRQRARDASAVARGSSRGASLAAARAFSDAAGEDEDDNDNDDDDDDDDETNSLAQTRGLTSSAFSITERSLQHERAQLPKLLAVGSLRGALDDVMYGLASPDASAMRLRTSYLDDELVDGAVLLEMQGPSPAEPFRFLGIKWLVKEARGAVKRLVKSRDFVVLEYCGVLMRPSGDRIGFHLVHSVELPACRELPERGLVRAKLSSCYLYRELPGGFVDMYMTATVEPRGKVLEAMAIRSAASALTSCWNSVACAQNKKLAWLLQNDGFAASSPAADDDADADADAKDTTIFGTARKDTVVALGGGGGGGGCSVCKRAFGAFVRASTCQLCYEPMCPRCRVATKLSSEALNATITKTAMVFCKTCIASAKGESAAEIAKLEIIEGRFRSRSRTSSSAGSFRTRGSIASLYSEEQLDSRLSERSNYTALFSELQPSATSTADADADDNADAGDQHSLRLSSLSRDSSRVRSSRGSHAKQLADWRTSSGDGGATGQWSRGTAATDALTLVDLDDPADEGGSPGDSECDDAPILLNDPPILLNDRVTCESLRAMDYIVLPATAAATAATDADELESLTASSVHHESDSDDESRMSQTSSIALMDAADDEVEAHDGFHPEGPRLDEEGESEAGSSCGGGVGSRHWAERDNNTHTAESQERISEVHAIVLAQSAAYDRAHQRGAASVGADEDTLAPLAGDDQAGAGDFQRPQNQSYQMQLWMQMNDLRHAAETTYQVARRNTDALLAQQGVADSESSRKLRRFSQPFQFNVVGLRAGRSMATSVAAAPPPHESRQYLS
ncbi:hypothetical protein PybrP1_000734 [[Pythium] brassicae (nom. inval.)]|nr:hypothetical protein PybrP1_000734 [[Pythium] brassicae (nom. inval.)]